MPTIMWLTCHSCWLFGWSQVSRTVQQRSMLILKVVINSLATEKIVKIHMNELYTNGLVYLLWNKLMTKWFRKKRVFFFSFLCYELELLTLSKLRYTLQPTCPVGIASEKPSLCWSALSSFVFFRNLFKCQIEFIYILCMQSSSNVVCVVTTRNNHVSNVSKIYPWC